MDLCCCGEAPPAHHGLAPMQARYSRRQLLLPSCEYLLDSQVLTVLPTKDKRKCTRPDGVT